jgi:PTH1 family peptidyl-tRNA hydrolase
VDHLADVWRFDGWKRDGDAVVSTGAVDGVRTRLVKPQTYMNLSGAVLRPYARRPFWAAATDLLVVVDDAALPLGTYRLRARGSAGGHNGLKSIEATLASREYARLRIGIRPSDADRETGPLIDFVLGPFGKGEREVIRALLPPITTAVETWLAHGIARAMNDHNATPRAEP